jgi:uncharacterized protein with GYD domain
MGHYLIEVGYTPESWANQIQTKANVIDRLTPALKACGAQLECLYYAFGDVDVVGVIDFKTPEDAAAFALAVGSSGALRSYRTTPLLSVDQGISSLRKASKIRTAYSPPIDLTVPAQKATARR